MAILAAFLLSTAPATAGVVSSADPRATAAGQEILRQGGSAVDAAMAMMLVLTVVEPQSSGIGGGGFIVVHDGQSGALSTVDGRETAPAAATPERFLARDGKSLPFDQAFPGGRSVGVPGNIRLMARAHERWGKLPWKALFTPAIRIADQGYTVNQTLATALATTTTLWRPFAAARALYWQKGAPKKAGAKVRNRPLAALLRQIAADGADAFYTGPSGRAIVAAVSKAPVNPAPLTQQDLSAYRVKDRDAVCGTYRLYRICSMAPPSSGAVTVLQILGMLERFDLKKMGARDPRSWHLIGESMQLAYADRDRWLGDPDFVSVPVAGLIDKHYLAERSALISPMASLAAYPSGKPAGAPERTAAISGEVPSTTHFVAVDDAGNIASMTSTIEGAFGSQLLVNGFVLNNELTDFAFAPRQGGALVANAVAPGKRPLSSMAPTIVYAPDGKPMLALGSAGGKRIIMHVAKTLIGVIDWDLPVDQAIALPNIFFGGQALLVEKDSWLAEETQRLAAFGQTVVPSALPSKVNAAEWVNGSWVGAADPRSQGDFAYK